MTARLIKGSKAGPLLRVTSGDITLVGTAHVSRKSVDVVRETIREIEPDVVCVELDESRLEALRDPTAWAEMPVMDLIRQGKGPQLLAQVLLGSYQHRIGEMTGVEPGQELLTAVDIADEVGADVVLADREVGITLRRAFQSMPFLEKTSVAWEILKAMLVGGDEEIDEESIDELLEEDALTQAMEELAELAPSASHVLIQERDAYMGTKILEAADELPNRDPGTVDEFQPLPDVELPEEEASDDAPDEDEPVDDTAADTEQVPHDGGTEEQPEVEADEEPGEEDALAEVPHGGLVAVLGAGHLAGVQEQIEAGQRTELDSLTSTESKRFPWGKTLAWGLAAAILGLFGFLAYQGFTTGNFAKFQEGLIWYFMLSGVFAAAGCIIAGGGILATIVAFLASPLTSLHPAVAAGWFAGGVEAWKREPRVGDIQGLREIYTFADMRENRLVRVLLVAALVNLGSIIGSWTGFAKLFDVADVVGTVLSWGVLG